MRILTATATATVFSFGVDIFSTEVVSFSTRDCSVESGMASAKRRMAQRLLCRMGYVFLAAFLGCDTGEIQNFAGIRVSSEFRLDRLNLTITLLDEKGNSLILTESILTPQIGVSLLPESKFTTNAKIYSMRGGERSATVYDGRLIDLRWSVISGTNARVLLSEIPRALIGEDPNRDTELGVIVVTVQTDKQGPFSDSLENTRIYQSAP
jgi:hypothetical protein